MKVFIKGLNSCAMRKQKLHQYREFLLSNGHKVVNRPQDSDTILLWTCAFRGDVRDNSVSEVRRYQEQFEAELIVAGCLPDIAPELLRKNFNGRIIPWRNDNCKMEECFGNTKRGFEDVPTTFAERNLCDDVEKFRRENPDKDATFHDMFIKLVVSEGCNYNCSYCSERLAFPPYRSFSEQKLVELCRDMVEKTGCSEVILLSDSLGDYGCDTGSSLPNLIHKLSGIHPDLKVALNNLNPADFIKFFDEMVNLLKNGIIRHLNLPIQSASERILELMNRPYDRRDIDRIFGLLNDIGFEEFDTHLIVGFPGETEEDFAETLRFILKHNLKYVLASGFMESSGMAACGLPDKVDRQTKLERLGEFYKQVSSAGLICNTDDSELSADRRRRLNLA